MKKMLVGFVGLSLMLAGSALAQNNAFSPFVDSEGNISRPTDFKTNPDWVHLGAWGVVNASNEGNGIHNVYTTRTAAASFKKNGIFPDGAPLVKEVRSAVGDNLTTGRAHWATDKQVWFVSIKDATNRFPNNPLWGDGWGWALFNADAPAKQVAADYKADCLSCHVPAEKSDWMYVHAYEPVLGAKALINKPDYQEASASDSNERHETSSMMAEAKTTEPAQMTAEASAAKAAETAQMTAEASAAKAAEAATSVAAVNTIDLTAAQRTFKQTCLRCHSDKEGKNGIGPSLAGVFGRQAGTGSGFKYSDAVKASNVVWTNEALDQYLLDSKNFIPKNRMSALFPQGVKNEEKRAEIIAYLESISN